MSKYDLLNISFTKLYGTFSCALAQLIDPFDLQFDLHLFSLTVSTIGRNKSRDLLHPISVYVSENKWRSNCKSKGSISCANTHENVSYSFEKLMLSKSYLDIFPTVCFKRDQEPPPSGGEEENFLAGNCCWRFHAITILIKIWIS